MSRQSTDEQLRFLLSCVRHSQNGKVDFVEVAKECGIVTKGAAAKRFERMMKANDINPNGGPSTASQSASPSTPAKKPKKDAKSTNSRDNGAKKRKIDDDSRGPSSADENDGTALKAEKPQQGGSPGTPNVPKPSRNARTASIFDKLNLDPNNEDETKNAGSEMVNDNIIGGMYDGAEGTTAVVYADPDWGSVFPSQGNTYSVTNSTDNPFDAFIHSDHPLHAQTSEFEAAFPLNTESNMTTQESRDGNGPAKLKIESIFIED